MEWSIEDVLKRWTALFKGSDWVNQYFSETRSEMTPAQLDLVQGFAETYRARLYDLSWFMRTLNETIDRRVNAEDGVKGRFWKADLKAKPYWMNKLY